MQYDFACHDFQMLDKMKYTNEPYVNLTHVFREHNRVADFLTSYSFVHSRGYKTDKDPPHSLCKMLQK